MKRILLSRSFRKQFKDYRRFVSETELVEDLKQVIRDGFRFGETKLKQLEIGKISLEILKLRFEEEKTKGRYLVGLVTKEGDYLPLYFALKKEKKGQNLGLTGPKKDRKVIFEALRRVVEDYQQHSKEDPRIEEILVDT